MSELMSDSAHRRVPGRFDTRRYIEASGMHGHAGIYPKGAHRLPSLFFNKAGWQAPERTCPQLPSRIWTG